MAHRGIVWLAALAAAACTRDTRGDDQAYIAKRVQDAIPQVETAVGLPFKTPPKFELRTPEQVKAFVTRQLTDSVALADLEGQEAAFKTLGLIPDTLSLRALLSDVLEEQIAGYYDPATKVLYVVQGAADEILGITVTHEMVHALQDQYVNLDSLQHIRGDDDALMAAQAVIEGQATFEQMRIMLGPNGGDVSPQIWTQIRETIRGEHQGMPVFAAAPIVVQDLLLFPYLSGAQFVHDAEPERPGAALFGAMPRSTEQILHPATYLGDPPDDPTRVTLPTPDQGRVIYNNTVGEFATRLFLFQHIQREAAAVEGAKGWDGDRFLLVETPKGRGVVWASVWDTALDAAEFARGLEAIVDLRYGGGDTRTIDPSGTSPIAGTGFSRRGHDVTVSSGELRGKPFVLYVDMPTGVSTRVDLTRVRFSP